MAFPHLSQPVAQGVRVLDADPDLGTNLHGERDEGLARLLEALTVEIGAEIGVCVQDTNTLGDR